MTTHFFLFTTGLVLITLYILFVLSLYFGMGRIPSNPNTKKYRVSIVVAARNEEENIADCIYALVNQDYPQDLLEIIVVDDRSEDTTGAILKEAAVNNPAVSVISIEETPDDCAPKKYALTRGIEKASGEIICTTDADCVPPQEWVSEMVSRFTEDVGFVAGFSPLYVYSIHSKENVSAGKRDGFLAKDKQEKTGNRIDAGNRTGLRIYEKFLSTFLYMDSIGLASASAGGIGWGLPWTCAGRNIAYRKAAFDEVGGYEDVKNVISGDDDLLMFLIAKKTDWRLSYAFGEKAAVPSYDDTDLRRFADQRVRHSSKFLVHPFRVQAASVALFLFYLTFLLYPVYMLAAWQFIPVYAVIAGGKLLGELITIKRGARLFGAQFRLGSFLIAYFIHPIVIVAFGVLGSRKKISWKGRSLGSKLVHSCNNPL